MKPITDEIIEAVHLFEVKTNKYPEFIVIDKETYKTLFREKSDELFPVHTQLTTKDGDKFYGIRLAITNTEYKVIHCG